MAAWSSWLETNDANARTRKSTKSIANEIYVFMTIDVDLLDIQDFLKELEDFHL